MKFRNDREVVATFIEETTERVREIENGLLGIEKNGYEYQDAQVHGMFRSAHSIKAGANLLDLKKVEGLAHRMEHVLTAMRKREIVTDENVVTTLLETLDAIRALVDDMENEAGYDTSAQNKKLKAILPQGHTN
jgi:two-component system chemotaxis sensor kinase CheA